MNCQEARDLLLEADRPALAGETTTELGLHVATCPDCGALAKRLLDAEAALDRALTQLSERPPRAARAPKPGSRRWMRLTTWSGLAAAAIVVLVLLPRQRPATGPPQVADQGEPGAVDVDVTSNAGKTAVVFRTADPKITVVWFFQD